VGRELQKAYGQEQQCVLTMPILEGLDGVQKMSKSLNNYISVVDTPREMFGKTMSVSDSLMLRYYELLSDLSLAELQQLKLDMESGAQHPRDVKIRLAKFLIARFHGSAAAQAAEDEFQRMFVQKGLPDDLPEFEFPASPLGQPVWIAYLMQNSKLVDSSSEARRLIQGNAVEMEGVKVTDPQLKLDLVTGQSFVLKAGKKKFARIKIV
jgi:tyrosyl-tRNA synthetase